MSTSGPSHPAHGWHFDHEPPGDWSDLVARFDTSFFHTPAGLRVGAPFGEPLYGRWHDAEGVGAIALGVATRCRLSGRSRHAYFPCPPALRPGADRATVDREFVRALRALGFAELGCDSFDAGSILRPAPRPNRWEYVVALADVRGEGHWPPNGNHRRTIRRGDREGWALRELAGEHAAGALHAVSATVIERATKRGLPFSADLPPAAWDPPEIRGGGSVRTRAAFHEDVLLAAILVGSSPRHAFYVMGGATEAGYAVGASAWLHAHTMMDLAAAGLETYNLGGVPPHAHDPNDPSHGLHRFKSGFGAAIVGCKSERRTLRRGHLLGHRLLSWASRWVRPEGGAHAHHA